MFHNALSGDTEFDAHPTTCASPTDERLVRAEADIERLLLLTEALWNVIKEEHGLEDDELVRRVLEVDLRDGRIDGRVGAKPPEDCPHCNRPVSSDRRYCLYCGEPVPVKLFAR